MLYHVPNRAKALAEIRRVLRPGGRFYASTVGDAHMKELSELVQRFDPEMARSGVGLGRAYIPFSLENGGEQLRAVFDHVEIVRYPDALDVTEVAPLVDYILSGSNIEEAGAAQRDTLTRFVQTEMDRQGVIHISKDSGVFVAW
jgi:SAM-dependent methyltransferase